MNGIHKRSLLCAPALIGLALSAGAGTGQTGHTNNAVLSSTEWVFLTTIGCMPVVVVAVSRYTTDAFVARYVRWMIAGMAMLSCAVLAGSAGRNTMAAVAVLAVSGSAVAWNEWYTAPISGTLAYGEELRRAIESLPEGPEPIFVGAGRLYLPSIMRPRGFVGGS